MSIDLPLNSRPPHLERRRAGPYIRRHGTAALTLSCDEVRKSPVRAWRSNSTWATQARSADWFASPAARGVAFGARRRAVVDAHEGPRSDGANGPQEVFAPVRDQNLRIRECRESPSHPAQDRGTPRAAEFPSRLRRRHRASRDGSARRPSDREILGAPRLLARGDLGTRFLPRTRVRGHERSRMRGLVSAGTSATNAETKTACPSAARVLDTSSHRRRGWVAEPRPTGGRGRSHGCPSRTGRADDQRIVHASGRGRHSLSRARGNEARSELESFARRDCPGLVIDFEPVADAGNRQ